LINQNTLQMTLLLSCSVLSDEKDINSIANNRILRTPHIAEVSPKSKNAQTEMDKLEFLPSHERYRRYQLSYRHRRTAISKTAEDPDEAIPEFIDDREDAPSTVAKISLYQYIQTINPGKKKSNWPSASTSIRMLPH